MKLENCGRCGLEAETGQDPEKEGSPVSWPVTFCPVHGNHCRGIRDWNAAQFAARTERINAAAVALMSASFSTDCGMWPAKEAISDATILIDAQDAAARVRWAEMQKGE